VPPFKIRLLIVTVPVPTGKTLEVKGTRRMKFALYTVTAGEVAGCEAMPLPGVTVIVRNQSTGAETSATTAQNGAYRFSNLEPGEYSLEASSSQLGHGRLDQIIVSAGHEARVQAAMEFEQLLPPSTAFKASREVTTSKITEEPKTQSTAPKLAASPVTNLTFASREIATGPTPVLETLLATEPLMTLNVPGHVPLSSSKPSSTESVLANSAPSGSGAPSGKPSVHLSGAVEQTLARLQPLMPAAPAVESGTAIRALASGRGAAMATAAARAALAAAAQIAQAQYASVLAASQENGPAAPAITAIVSAAELQALPVNGRHWQDFVLDNIPTSVTPEGGAGQISLMGAGQQPTEITVDGMSQGLAYGPTGESGQGSSGRGALGQGERPVGMAQVGSGGHGLALSEAAIRAVETVAGNVEAAAARAAG